MRGCGARGIGWDTSRFPPMPLAKTVRLIARRLLKRTRFDCAAARLAVDARDTPRDGRCIQASRTA
ncbi:hypothetical protein AC233_09395 [Burkholderia sp. HB1]|nr:hypothetical protein AC233_09395 [Burkholderia sp. HB1]